MIEFAARLPLRHGLSESTLIAVRAYLAAFATGQTRIDETGTDLFVLFEHSDDLKLLKRQFPHVIEPPGPRAL